MVSHTFCHLFFRGYEDEGNSSFFFFNGIFNALMEIGYFPYNIQENKSFIGFFCTYYLIRGKIKLLKFIVLCVVS